MASCNTDRGILWAFTLYADYSLRPPFDHCFVFSRQCIMPKGNKKKTTKDRIRELEAQAKNLEQLRDNLPDLPGQKKREKKALLAQMRLNTILELSNPFRDVSLPWPGKKEGGKRRRTRRKRKTHRRR